MRYFGYGSNLCAEDLSRWCRERALAPVRLNRVGAAFLPDRRLAFNHESASRSGGVLDIPHSRGIAVAGVLFGDLSDETIDALDRKEAEGHSYRRIETVVLTDDGAEVPTFTYEVVPARRRSFVAPAPAYLDIVRRGYAEHGLGTEPLEAAASGAPHAGPINRVFVYGTLRRGEERHAVLVRHGAVEGTKALTAGTLLDLGPYPGLVLDGPVASVTGEVYTTPEPEELFTELDAIETFRGYGAGESVYRRAIVRVRSAELGSALAWTYVYVGSRKESHVMASGDWHDRERS